MFLLQLPGICYKRGYFLTRALFVTKCYRMLRRRNIAKAYKSLCYKCYKCYKEKSPILGGNIFFALNLAKKRP